MTDQVFANSGKNSGKDSFRNKDRVTFRKNGFCQKCTRTGARFCNHCLACGSVEYKRSECPVVEEEEKNC